ncbi:TPA: hypothetical protein ACVO2I_002219 [Legionella pneumophila]
MGITIEKIADNEHFEYKGDVRVTGSIGKNATVIIKDGSLIVDGNIESNTEIRLSQENNSVVVSSSSFFMGNVSIGSVGGTSTSVSVHGNIENSVIISSKAADINVDGNIGSNCSFNTQSGDIKVGNVGNGSNLKTMSGDVKAGNVGTNCSLSTMSGDVKACDIGSNSTLKTMSGDVKVLNADKSVSLETMSGSITENGVKRKKEKGNTNTVSIGNMSFIGGSRIIVNGRDITSLVNANSSSSSTPTDEAPIRYTK